MLHGTLVPTPKNRVFPAEAEGQCLIVKNFTSDFLKKINPAFQL
jgi:hypothetical protein